MQKKLKPTAEKVLAYMILHGSITVREGQLHLHTTEVRSRVSELKKAGFPITEKWESATMEDGTVYRYKRYSLNGGSGGIA
jgi:hypothetical protein